MRQPHWTMLTCYGPMVPVRTVAPIRCNTASQHYLNVCKLYLKGAWPGHARAAECIQPGRSWNQVSSFGEDKFKDILGH